MPGYHKMRSHISKKAHKLKSMTQRRNKVRRKKTRRKPNKPRRKSNKPRRIQQKNNLGEGRELTNKQILSQWNREQEIVKERRRNILEPKPKESQWVLNMNEDIEKEKAKNDVEKEEKREDATAVSTTATAEAAATPIYKPKDNKYYYFEVYFEKGKPYEMVR